MRGWGSVPVGASPSVPREKPGASGWALRVPSAAAGLGPIVCSLGEGSRRWGGTASGGAGPRGAAASPQEGPACPFLPRGPPACARGTGALQGCSPRGAEGLSSCSWSWATRAAALMAAGGLVLAGMLPAVPVKEPGQKDEVRRMGEQKEGGGLACWEAGAANLTQVWLLGHRGS